MRFEAVLSESIAKQAEDHLLAQIRLGTQQEDLCFAVWNPSTGKNRTTGIVTDIILPRDGERHLHGNVSFEPHYLTRSIRSAVKKNSGIAFMHSHPSPGLQSMSNLDILAERDRIAPPARSLGLPLLGLTVGTDGIWSARFWKWNGHKYTKSVCDKVRVVGRHIHLSIPVKRATSFRSNRLRRTIDTWGPECQFAFANLHIGIVGLGSVGSIIAESLARMGATKILLIDADQVEEHNLDRLLYATSKNIGDFKVDLVAKNLRQSANVTSFQVNAIRAWIQEHDAYTAALDCDVLFCAVDRPLPKDLLNHIAYVHNIPVIFGGIRVATKTDGSLGDATWSVMHIGPGSQCLRCNRQYTSSEVMLELDGSLDNQSYIDKNSLKLGNQNVFPFALNIGSLMVLEMIRSVISEPWWGTTPSKLHYSFVSNRLTHHIDKCSTGCSIDERMGLGDRWTYQFLEDSVHRRNVTCLSKFQSLFHRLLNKFS
ncbi:MAG: ThiF family adenylyltransferase [Bacteroidetes bacterium]|nr:ThiF family adenylyltransferase [Bacteroidota bacterium]